MNASRAAYLLSVTQAGPDCLTTVLAREIDIHNVGAVVHRWSRDHYDIWVWSSGLVTKRQANGQEFAWAPYGRDAGAVKQFIANNG